jgi:hypothetical protein
MARRRVVRERDYQHRGDPVRAIAERAQAKLAGDIKDALRHLRSRVPVKRISGLIRLGKLKEAAAAVPLEHFAEVLKAPFAHVAEIWNDAADHGASKITADFKRAGKRVRYRPVARRLRKYNPDQLRDNYGRFAGSGETKERTVDVGGRQVIAELSPVSAASGDKLVTIDAKAFDRQFARETEFYVGPHGSGSGGIAGRYGRFQDYLASHDRFQASEVGVMPNGQVNFTNGRHRYAVLRDAGLRGIPLAMDSESVRNARRHGYLIDVAKAIGDGFDFDMIDDDTQTALRDAQDALIAELSEKARDTVESVIAAGVGAGDSPDEIAADLRDTITLTERQAAAVSNYRRLLEDLDQDALERELRNKEMDDDVQDAIDSGEFLPDDVIDRLTGQYADNYLDYRADAIARTESLRSANSGLRDSYRQAADRGVFPSEAVRRYWQIATDERVCPVCQSIVDNNPDGVGLDDDFQSDDGPVDDAPIHTSCRCTIEYRTNLDMLPDDGTEDEDADMEAA